MAVVIQNNATTIWDCESTTGAVGNKPVLETEILKEGLNSVDFTTTETTTEAAYDGAIPDLTGQHIRMWYTSITFPNMASKVLGGLTFYATDGTNTAYWAIAGKDTYSGGWINALVYIDSTPDSGTVNSASITEMGFIHMDGFATSSYATRPKNQINVWIDYLRYGNGLLAYGNPIFGIDELAIADQAAGAGYGVIETTNGAHFVYGSLEYGRISEQTIYQDENELMVFANANVSTSLYGIKFTGDTAVTSTFSIKSTVISSAGERFYLDLDDVNIADLEFTGNTVTHANTVSFLANSALTEVSSNSFNDISSILQQGCNFKNNNISYSGTIVVISGGIFSGNTISYSISASSVIAADLNDLENNTFISTGSNHAVELTSVGSGVMTWTNETTDFDIGVVGSPIVPTATGNEDIYVSAITGTVDINVASGATIPSIRSDGAIVNVIAGLVTADWTVNPSITGYEYAIYTVDAIGSLVGQVEVDHVEVAISDSFSYSYTYSAGTIIAVQLLFGDGSVNDYEEYISYKELASSNQSFTVNLDKDNNN